jgi:hypothetical protein
MTLLLSLWLVVLNARAGRDFEELPVDCDTLGGEERGSVACDRVKVPGREREDGRARAREADAEKARVRRGRQAGRHLGQTRDEFGAVRLMHAVLHRLVDEFRVWRGLAERGREHGETLEVEDLQVAA